MRIVTVTFRVTPGQVDTLARALSLDHYEVGTVVLDKFIRDAVLTAYGQLERTAPGRAQVMTITRKRRRA
jgi:hypothetical protein